MWRSVTYARSPSLKERPPEECFDWSQSQLSHSKIYPWISFPQLPLSKGFNNMLVVVDKLTKAGIFIPTTMTITEKETTQLLFNMYPRIMDYLNRSILIEISVGAGNSGRKPAIWWTFNDHSLWYLKFEIKQKPVYMHVSALTEMIALNI